MKKVLIFAGTTEGRELAERLFAADVPVTVSVATEYGAEIMEEHPGIEVLSGRMGREEIAALIRGGAFCCAADATHPFATRVSEEIRAACLSEGVPCIRAARATDPGKEPEHFFDSVSEAASFLKDTEGGILLTTGSKDLPVITEILGETGTERLFVRVLPSAESLAVCSSCGIPGKRIAAMQGPFDEEMNCALIRHTGASWLVTKETGGAGGYEEKLSAARRCGIRTVVIRNPENRAGDDAAKACAACGAEKARVPGGPRKMGTEEAFREILRMAREDEKLQITLAGAGPGGRGCITEEVLEAVAGADAVFGSRRILAEGRRNGILKDLKDAKDDSVSLMPAVFQEYSYDGVRAVLSEHPEFKKIVVLFSGDTGFYSGAASFLKRAGDKAGEIRLLPGISSVAAFAARTGVPWQDMKLVSSHGRKANITGEVRRNRRCLILSGGCRDLIRTGELLRDAEQSGVSGPLKITLGYQLTCPEEEIKNGGTELLLSAEKEGMYIFLVENEGAELVSAVPGIPDTAFLREKVPMTKEEIRVLSLSRLGLTESAVVWDIGAGTGSVSVEAARTAVRGQVWSVECDPAALNLLRKNRKKFALQNMEIVEACAPEGLSDLPAPTHVFVGGSRGNMRSILEAVLGRNPAARIVVNCVTMETLFEASEALQSLTGEAPQCVQVSVTRAEPVGRYHMFRAANPVFILSADGGKNGVS